MPHTQSGPSARRPSLSAITLHLSRPAANAVSDPRYAVRYAPGGRGHAITNWQCISQEPGTKIVILQP